LKEWLYDEFYRFRQMEIRSLSRQAPPVCV
jgi:hypothetical protein